MSTLSVDTIQGQTTAANVKLPAGSVLQTLQTQDNTFVANSSTSYTATSVLLAITPKYATSKILVSININGQFVNAVTTAGSLALYADSGSGYASLIEFDNNVGYVEAGSGRVFGSASSFQFLHDVNTTNATTYKVYIKRATGSGLIYLNNYATSQVTRSSIVCQEISQ